MNFEQGIIADLLREVRFDTVLEKLAKERCVQALKEIRAVLDDDTLEDPECFERIEKVVEIYEDLGIGGGSRHDFG